MEDYTKDTEDLVRLSNSMMEAYKEKVRDLERLVAAIVHTVGKVEIPRHLIIYDNDLTLLREDNYANDSIMFRSVKQ